MLAPVCLLIFAIDLLHPELEVAVGVFYTIPLLLGPWLGGRRLVLGLAASCTLLAVGALLGSLSIGDVDPERRRLAILLGNEALVVFAIWITANLGLFRMEVEARLQASRELLATTLGSIGDGVIATDDEGRVSFLNAAAEELTGWTGEEALGRSLEEVFRLGGDDFPASDSAAREGPSPIGGGARLLRARQGEEHPVEARSTPVRDQEGRPQGRVLVFRDVAERQEYESAIRRLAFRDVLTGLPNRASLWDRLGLELAHARREGRLLGLLYLDLDDFKRVNDTRGHRAGDALLRGVAARLRASLREGDTVARIGGDEFTVLLPGLKRSEDAAVVCRKILERLREPIEAGDRAQGAPASIGIAIFPRDAGDPDGLLHAADQAMYAAKQRGGGYAELGAQPPEAADG